MSCIVWNQANYNIKIKATLPTYPFKSVHRKQKPKSSYV